MSRVTATERVQRILAVVPWILQNQGTGIDEICQRFGLTRDDLVGDLEFVFYNVGLHPFTPDMLAEVTFDDDRVHIHMGDYFRRPLRLSHAEALNLVAAGRALAGRPGIDPDGTLDRAVAKVAAVLGSPSPDSIEVELGAADPDVFDAANAAVTGQRQLRIDYYSHNRDEPSTRVVDPYQVVSREGRWYLYGHCHRADGTRLFRLDRVLDAELLDETFERSEDAGEATFELDVERSVEIVAAPAAAKVAEEFPVDHLETLPDGRVRIVVSVSAQPWLERLLLRLGPDLTVTDLDDGSDLRYIAQAAAERILARYGHGDRR